MKKFYVYSAADKIEYSEQVEFFLNNPKIEVIDISHQKMVHWTKKVNGINYFREEYLAYITYKELEEL